MRIGRADTDTSIALVAEIGNNHEGSVGRAQEMIGRAWEAGASAVKLQTFVPELFVSRLDRERLQQMQRFAISLAETQRLIRESTHEGIHVFSTPLDLESLAALLPVVSTLKVASGDITYIPLLRAIAEARLDTVLSTGGSSLSEVADAVATLDHVWKLGPTQPDLAILHCVSSYPAPPASVNLRALSTLKAEFPNATVGYSDHVPGIEASVAAAATGARIIEKHFTLDHSQSEFRDHALSADPDELRELRDRLDFVQEVLGSGFKEPDHAELELIPVIRRSLTLTHDCAVGHRLTYSDVACMRPGTGLPPAAIDQTVGRRLRVPKRAGEVLVPSDLA